MKWLNLALLVLITIIGLGWHFYHKKQESTLATLGPAQAFSAPHLAGQAFDFSASTITKPTILHFWATWCAPCLVEFPTLIDLATQSPNTDILAVAVQDEQAAIERFLAKTGKDLPPNFKILLDPDKAISETLYGTVKLPETLIIAPDFQITHKVIGPEENWAHEYWQKKLKKLSD